LNRWRCACKISFRYEEGFGFLLALDIPTDKETYVSPFLFIETRHFKGFTIPRLCCSWRLVGGYGERFRGQGFAVPGFAVFPGGGGRG